MISHRSFIRGVLAMAASGLLAGWVGASKDLKKGDHRAKPINTAYRLQIEFGPGRTEVKPQYAADIKRVADDLQTYPYARCEIRGYTDNVGADQTNEKLSQARAESVRQYLLDKFGISPFRVTAKGFGKADPVADNKTEDGRRQNRRIVAVIRGQPPGEPDFP